MSIESRLHSVLKHGFGYDSGPRFNGTRHNAHREAMNPSLAGLSEAVQKRQSRIEAGVNHREAMKPTFAGLSEAVQKRQSRIEAGVNHREAMKPTLAGLSEAVQNRQAQRDTHREGMKSVLGELKERRALIVQNHFSSLTKANKQLNFGRQQAQKTGMFGLASFRRRVASIGSGLAYRLGFKSLSYSSARAATDRAVQAKENLRSGANSSALDYASSDDGKQTLKRTNSLKRSFPALENALLVGPNKMHQQSQGIYNDVGSRALLRAEERTNSIFESMRSMEAGVARSALNVLDSEFNPRLRSAAKFLGLYQSAFKSSFKDQHRELASRIENTVRQAKGYASEAYKSQARADVAETVGDVFRAGSKGVGLVNRIAPTAEGEITKYSLEGASGIANLFQAGFSHQASKRFETASNQAYRNNLMTAFFGAKHYENKEGARLATVEAVKTGLGTGISLTGDALHVKEKAQETLGIGRREGETGPEVSGAGIQREALTHTQTNIRGALRDGSLNTGRWGFSKFFSSKKPDRNEGMRGFLNAGKGGVRNANRADAANVADLMRRGVGGQLKPQLTRQNAQRNIHIESPTKPPLKRLIAQRNLQIDAH